MNKTLKNVVVFLSASTLLALCYPQFESGSNSLAQTMDAVTSKNVEIDNPPKGDGKVRPRTVSDNTSPKPKSETNTEIVAVEATANGATVSTLLPSIAYSATAYALRGRTAIGSGVRRGIIAADPRHLPLGTKVKISAGVWSGTYTVADTGGAIHGRKIDVWVPNNGEARQFGRRKIMLTVLTKARKK